MEILSINTNYLNTKHLKDGMFVKKVAYVQKAEVKYTKNGESFAKFYLKDCNSYPVIGRLFSVHGETLAVDTAAFKGRMVEVTGTAQVFNGMFNLTLETIDSVSDANSISDLDKFIGKVEFDLSDFEYALNKLYPQFSIPIEWKRQNLDVLCDGRAGAYARFVEVAFSTIKPFLTKELMKVFVITADYYHRYLNGKSDVLGTFVGFELLHNAYSVFSKDDSQLVILDTLRSVLGMEEPKHLYAHLIKDAIVLSEKMINLNCRFDALLLATSATIGGVELLKY